MTSDEVRLPAPPPLCPGEDLDGVYCFGYPKRGRAIIINNENFHPQSGLNDREGSSLDAKGLQDVLEGLEFDVKRYNDLTASEIKEKLKDEADKYDHDKADCLAVAILSHGGLEPQKTASSQPKDKTIKTFEGKNVKLNHQCIFGVDGDYIFVSDITALFQDSVCPGLSGKPRLFFIQACRGELFDDGLEVHVIGENSSAARIPVTREESVDTGALDSSGKNEETAIAPVQIFKDFLVMNATPPGYYAWRRNTSGSWFIQSLCKVLTEKQLKETKVERLSLATSLTHVSRMVAQCFQSDRKNAEKKKQVAVLDLMLTKEIYFPKKQTFGSDQDVSARA